jgi:hypothetical protein
MKKIILMTAAAGSLLVGGAVVANAQASIGNGLEGGEYSGYNASPNNYYVWPEARAQFDAPCGFVTIRERHDGKIVVRTVPRC